VIIQIVSDRIDEEFDNIKLSINCITNLKINNKSSEFSNILS
jgi:hypothetical protein